jgi:hypothetical protein
MTTTEPAPTNILDVNLSEQLLGFANELQQLRVDVDAAEARLFIRAAEIEVTVPSHVWTEFYGSFDNFLQRHDICQAPRYRNYLRASEQSDIQEVASRIGVPAVLQAAKIADPDRRGKFLEAARTRCEQKGVPWSDQEARLQRFRIGGSLPKDSRWNARATEQAKMQQRLLALEKENQELKQALQEAQEELEALRAKKGGREQRASR